MLLILSLIVFALILSLLVLIHEFGHYITAKKLGIKVEEFGFGFPPKVFGIKRGETLYTINLLPFGGFVKLFGEDDAGGGKIQLKTKNEKFKDEDLKRAFFARPPLQKAAVILAGVFMNAVLAVVIFYLFMVISNFKTVIPLLSPDFKFFGVTQKNVDIQEKDFVITYVSSSSPAEAVGIKTPSQVLSVNSFQMKDRNSFIKYINENKGQTVQIKWKDLNSGNIHTASLTPRKNPPKDQGPLGVGFLPAAILSYNTPTQKLFSGITYPINLMIYSFDVMKQLVTISVEKKSVEPASQGFSGPVGIYKVIEDILKIADFKEKILALLNLAGALSISLAFFNVLPIPALDGGRLFFIIIEFITRRRISSRVESYIHAGGFVVLIALILFISYFDIRKFFN